VTVLQAEARTSTEPRDAPAAADYFVSRAWVPVPVEGKRPLGERWQQRTLADAWPAEFKGHNIGLLLGVPSGNLADVDCDCTEAMIAAGYLLPPTKMIHGRASRPNSHGGYVTDAEPKTTPYRDSAIKHGGMLVELRGTGAQTVYPPSTHVSGEPTTWGVWPPEPARVRLADLRRAVAEVAAASLLARHHPGDGSRHDFALALAGTLARGGYPQARAELLVEAVAHAAGDRNPRDRRKCVLDTYGRRNGHNTTGAPTLGKMVGDAVVKLAEEWLGLRTIAAVEPQARRAVVVPVVDVVAEQVTWLWPDRIPRGKLTLLDGDPGLGKSTLALHIAARVSTGGPLPGRCEPRAPAGVIILSAEDGLADTIRPRLDAAGADLTRVFAITAVTAGAEGDLPELPTDCAAVEEECKRADAALVVVDPLMAYLGSDVNAHKDQDVRRALAPLAAMAERTGAAVLVVRHLNKTGGTNALYRGGGSIGIIGAARSGLCLAKDPSDEERRVLAQIKCNLGRLAPSLCFRLEPGPSGVAAVAWCGESNYSAEALMASSLDTEEDRTRLQDASEVLREILAAGPLPADEVRRLARSRGAASAALTRAKKALRVRSRKTGGPGDPWVWELPPDIDLLVSPPSCSPYSPFDSRAATPRTNPLIDGKGEQGKQGEQGEQGQRVEADVLAFPPVCPGGAA
jgi:hypothetical protein